VPEGYVVDVVSTWTGQLAGTLRAAWRLTIEDFADRLGVSVRTISKWEADQASVPSPSMQQILDTALDPSFAHGCLCGEVQGLGVVGVVTGGMVVVRVTAPRDLSGVEEITW
jgi:DNA-binding XRE family transcriptional regulator